MSTPTYARFLEATTRLRASERAATGWCPGARDSVPDEEDGVADRERLVEALQLQSLGFAGLGCPFYEAIAERLIVEARAGGPGLRVLDPHAEEPFQAAHVVRFLGGVHRMVLSGAAPGLARHFPSTGGDGDADASMAELLRLGADPPPEVLDALTRPPQTNEVGRSVALASGLLTVADALGMPLRLREIGSSAGLNLRLDSYWYEQGGRGWGEPASALRFIDPWEGGTPPLGAGATIVERRGCDRDPIDVTTDDGALTLLSYIWPEPAERFARARAAIGIAHDRPATIERADVTDWLPHQLEDRPAGTALVVFHSVVWQYLGEATQHTITALMQAAGAVADPTRPLAWLRLEPHPEHYVPAELRLTVWRGDDAPPDDRLLATTLFPGGPVQWLDGVSV